MSRADDIRKFVQRDWAAVADSKRTFWLEQRRKRTPAEALRAADELRRHARAVNSTPPDREPDLQAHTRLAKILRRVPSSTKR